MQTHDSANEPESRPAPIGPSNADPASARLPRQWLEHAPGFVAVLAGPEMVLEYVNPAFAKLVERPVADLIGARAWCALAHMRGQGFEEALADVWRSGRPLASNGTRVRLADSYGGPGREIRLDFAFQPMFDASGATVGIFVQGHDVSDRHAFTEALQKADKNKDLFLCTLSHELRNPLSAISNALFVLNASEGQDNPVVRRLVEVMQRQLKGATELVDELYDVSSVKLGKAKLDLRREVVLQQVIRDSVTACSTAIARKHQALNVIVPDDPVLVQGDELKLGRVINNLLTNANKYTPAGGQIEVRLVCEREAVITVSDSGRGMSPETLAHVFDVFYQEQDASVTEHGLGIGLTLVRQLVELHGGTVEAHSDGLGLGATFVVRLPTRCPCAGRS